jgi:hypothetical protein
LGRIGLLLRLARMVPVEGRQLADSSLLPLLSPRPGTRAALLIRRMLLPSRWLVRCRLWQVGVRWLRRDCLRQDEALRRLR